MELKDNFTNRYFKPDLVKTQMYLVNQPTATDAYADAFSKGGQGAAKSSIDYEANALMSGIGAGLKGSADDKRQEKLDSLLKMTGQINAQSAYLEAQMQEEQQKTMQTQQFVKSQSYAFSELARAVTAGDSGAMSNLSRGILQSYKQMSGDSVVGDFDHYHDGTIYYINNETGEKGGLSIPQLLYQSGMKPEELFGPDAPTYMAAWSPGFKGQYENTQELQRLERDKQQANINNTNAQTGLYGSQTQKNENEMNAPKAKYDDKTLTHIRTTNSDWVNKSREEHRKSLKISKAYDNIANIIQGEINNNGLIGGREGSSTLAIIRRFVNKSNTKSEQNQAMLEFQKLPLMEDLKRIYGAQVSDIDLKSFLSTLPSLDKNPKASILEAKNRSNEIKQQLKEDQTTQQVLEDEFGYSEPYNSLAIKRRVDELMGAESISDDASGNQQQTGQNQRGDTVTMLAPDGSSRQVPSNQVQIWKQKGARVVNE